MIHPAARYMRLPPALATGDPWGVGMRPPAACSHTRSTATTSPSSLTSSSKPMASGCTRPKLCQAAAAREWKHFYYEPKGVSFTYGTGSTSSRDDTHEITLPQFSSASVPQVTHLEDGRDNNTYSSDFILFAGGNVWSLDWCPRLCDKPSSPVNCEIDAIPP